MGNMLDGARELNVIRPAKVGPAPAEEPDVAHLNRDAVVAAGSLGPFFHPRSVALIGASRDHESIGYRLLEAIRNQFQGPVYPVNPHASFIAGVPVYASPSTLPASVDLAIIAVPRDAVRAVVDDCIQQGIRALLVITAGFAECGPSGKELQNQLLDKVRAYGIRLIGPNCLGLITTDPEVRLNASLSRIFPPPGSVAMSSGSGALDQAVLSAASRLGVGISSYVSVGNRTDVSSNDLLEYWETDDNTDVILLYMESFGNPRRFARIARRVARHKPIVAVKPGRTKAGQRAAGSNTAALAASDTWVNALFQQAGVIRAETVEEMLDLAMTLSTQPLPLGHRVAVLSNAGGPAILCADACQAGGLLLPELSEKTRTRLAHFLPPAATLINPVDMIASAGPDHFERAIEIILASGEVDALIIIHMAMDLAESNAVARAVSKGVAAVRATTACDKPVLTCLMPELQSRTLSLANTEAIPCFGLPETAARVLGKIMTYAQWRAQPLGDVPVFSDINVASARCVIRKALEERGPGCLTSEEVRMVLEAMRLPVSPGAMARTGAEAAAVARDLGFPVALKLASHLVADKTELGLVRLNLNNEAAVRGAFQDILDRLAHVNLLDAMDSVLVQPMVQDGTEVMVSVIQDPLFGPLIAFGLGGIHVEILKDFSLHITPLTERDAREMVQGVRGYRLLQGHRGHTAADVDALENLLIRVSHLIEEVPEIQELDLNPIFALRPGQGCRIVDARVGYAGGISVERAGGRVRGGRSADFR
jgi:acetate---CoA ligase (ADP-forming)